MNFKCLLATLSLAAAASTPAFSATIDFTGANNSLGHSQTFGSGAGSVTAYAFNTNGSNASLFGKNGGGSENGLGITGTLDNEITSSTFIQLNVSNLTTPFSLAIGSTQSQEGFSVYVSNTLGSLGTLYQDIHTPTSDPFSTALISTTDTYVSVTADGNPSGVGNVLLDTLTTSPATTSPVPEPSSLVLLGTGILSAAGALRRKLSA